jgi:hypothetical protein
VVRTKEIVALKLNERQQYELTREFLIKVSVLTWKMSTFEMKKL